MATAAPSLTTDDALLAEVSPDRLLRDTAAIARFVRLAGTPEERAAFEVIAAELRRIGLEVRRYECETYISIPGKASCRVLSPEPADLACITHSMAKPVDGLEAELVDAGAGSAEELKRAGAAGRIALVDGLASPGKVRAAERAGALAAVFVNDQRLHEMIVSAQYGSPTPATLGDLPKIAALSVTEDSGALLRRHLAGGPVRLRLAAAVDTGWRTIPLLSAELQPEPTDGSYVFWGTHVDSWHYGATDNAAGNAVALELARILVAHRSELRRGVRFVFWSGHSHGRYAGSCWYADHFWQDLYDHAVAAMSIDSPGGRGATELGSSKVMDELQAVVIRAKLSGIGTLQAARARVAEQYRAALGSMPVDLPDPPPTAEVVYRTFPVLLEERDRIQRGLVARGIAARTYYGPPLHLQPAFRCVGFGPGDLPATEMVSERLLCLPVYSQMTDDQVDYVIESLWAELRERST